MKNILKFNLQMFGEGGDGGSSAGSAMASGAEGGASEEIAAKNEKVAASRSGNSEDLSDVVYGISDNDSQESTQEDNTKSSKSKSQQFEDLIKGDFKDEFTKRTQNIIDKRFRQAKEMESQLKSHDNILNMLAEKYGVKSGDIDGLTKALENDESFFEEEALKKGLSVEQYKELRQLQRENEEFRQAQEEAEARARTDQIYSEWTRQAEELKEKYGLSDFDLATEVENPEFAALLRNPNISVESAYKAIHFDDMVGGAMAHTAKEVTQKMASNIANRNSRIAENGISHSATSNFKTDVNSLTNADLREIRRRVERGETIKF